MSVQGLIDMAQDTLTVKRVFGEPYERNGVTVIPAAQIRGGGGAGEGEGPESQGKGSGGGFGLTAKPSGAYIIRDDGNVRWWPAFDLNRAILGGQVVAIIALLTIRTIVKSRAKGARPAS